MATWLLSTELRPLSQMSSAPSHRAPTLVSVQGLALLVLHKCLLHSHGVPAHRSLTSSPATFRRLSQDLLRKWVSVGGGILVRSSVSDECVSGSDDIVGNLAQSPASTHRKGLAAQLHGFPSCIFPLILFNGKTYWSLVVAYQSQVTNKKFPIQGYHVSHFSKIRWDEKMVWVKFKLSSGLESLWHARSITNTNSPEKREGVNLLIRTLFSFILFRGSSTFCLFIFTHYFGVQPNHHLICLPK